MNPIFLTLTILLQLHLLKYRLGTSANWRFQGYIVLGFGSIQLSHLQIVKLWNNCFLLMYGGDGSLSSNLFIWIFSVLFEFVFSKCRVRLLFRSWFSPKPYNNFWVFLASNPPKIRPLIFLLFKLSPAITKFLYVLSTKQSVDQQTIEP